MAREGASGGEALTLLGLWASPFVIRARIALNLKGLTYGYTEESLYDKSELLVKSNPVHKKVPVLIHDGKPVCESQNIVQRGRRQRGKRIAVLETLEEQAFKECCKGQQAAFFGGDSVNLVDVVLGSLLGWLQATEAICGVKVIDTTRMPLLAAWAERFRAIDGVKGVITR
ncbi:unnamed protein product [Urochloa decumbens]|uniref:glutathione transferase n=1 Tax=Urochloa decumbens TaxID=240449 RepID=A0ABC9FPC7_9POAL